MISNFDLLLARPPTENLGLSYSHARSVSLTAVWAARPWSYLEPAIKLNWREAPKTIQQSDQTYFLPVGGKEYFVQRWVQALSVCN